ncbi:hypothetical protein OF83DRAFT_1089813, partial [Amylostereum chailletii]
MEGEDKLYDLKDLRTWIWQKEKPDNAEEELEAYSNIALELPFNMLASTRKACPSPVYEAVVSGILIKRLDGSTIFSYLIRECGYEVQVHGPQPNHNGNIHTSVYFIHLTTHLKIDIKCTSSGAAELPILSGGGTHLMNFISSAKMVCAYPDLTFTNMAMFPPLFNREDISPAVLLALEQGITLSTHGHGKKIPSSHCYRELRTFADSFYARIR